MKPDLKTLRAEYGKLQKQLSGIGWISHGYVQDRGAGAGGPCYQWTRKVKKKTVSLALSKEQFQAMQEAIDNWRHAHTILARMEQISRQIIFTTLPDTRRRKPLTKKVLGIN
jgi:cyclopropane fatty-acyl-phospholipid synthase-like methyltransferase